MAGAPSTRPVPGRSTLPTLLPAPRAGESDLRVLLSRSPLPKEERYTTGSCSSRSCGAWGGPEHSCSSRSSLSRARHGAARCCGPQVDTMGLLPGKGPAVLYLRSTGDVPACKRGEVVVADACGVDAGVGVTDLVRVGVVCPTMLPAPTVALTWNCCQCRWASTSTRCGVGALWLLMPCLSTTFIVTVGGSPPCCSYLYAVAISMPLLGATRWHPGDNPGVERPGVGRITQRCRGVPPAPDGAIPHSTGPTDCRVGVAGLHAGSEEDSEAPDCECCSVPPAALPGGLW